eukprot:TRINITY_DN889_c0_g1_i3.p5 TRINITY_DN889_c0_g1~~TRINITY_DN889_c0_g1_i3.p5  ORF type:complete len:142 (+),score=12.29 TRINITY_DN889_c0_g1_i3:935-1360(+)
MSIRMFCWLQKKGGLLLPRTVFLKLFICWSKGYFENEFVIDVKEVYNSVLQECKVRFCFVFKKKKKKKNSILSQKNFFFFFFFQIQSKILLYTLKEQNYTPPSHRQQIHSQSTLQTNKQIASKKRYMVTTSHLSSITNKTS